MQAEQVVARAGQRRFTLCARDRPDRLGGMDPERLDDRLEGNRRLPGSGASNLTAVLEETLKQAAA
ncbi:MAG TPA: hypothetical protein VIW26_15385, partial [Gemmatimonadales bacterium]